MRRYSTSLIGDQNLGDMLIWDTVEDEHFQHEPMVTTSSIVCFKATIAAISGAPNKPCLMAYHSRKYKIPRKSVRINFKSASTSGLLYISEKEFSIRILFRRTSDSKKGCMVKERIPRIQEINVLTLRQGQSLVHGIEDAMIGLDKDANARIGRDSI